MPDIVNKGKPMEQRVSDRLKPSGEGLGADHHVVKGTGPNRTHTFIHHGGTTGGSKKTPNANDRGKQ